MKHPKISQHFVFLKINPFKFFINLHAQPCTTYLFINIVIWSLNTAMNENRFTIKEKNAQFDLLATTIAGAKRTKRGLIIPIDDNGGIYHITDISPLNTPEHKQFGDAWVEYRIICNGKDVGDIIGLKNTEDYLLKIRADAILDNVRAIRVFQRRFNNSEDMTISKWYAKNDRENLYIENISKGNRDKLNKVPAGTAMISRANAICMAVEKGNIIVVSERLIYSLYFFNIFLYGTSLGFNEQECFEAYLIALRTYYGYESIDFDLDPRGIFPTHVESSLQELTTLQYNFILGHEYAHHLLGHLKDSKLKDGYFFTSDNTRKTPHYKYRFKEEYDADWYALKNIKGNKNLKDDLANAAFCCFYFFYVLEQVGEYLAPQGNAQGKTHPYALDRLKNLRRRLKSSYGLNGEYLNNTKGYIDQMTKHFLSEILPYHTDEFELYGSHYFERFKSIILEDRVDY